uniref:CSON005348 protein n=1 Tax=Culicoides sonorensis TaxID=179676 RepID=A0A336M6Y6_CULSO
MHNITEVLLKNHQIMPYKRKPTINNFGIPKNSKYCNSYTNNSNFFNHRHKMLQPQKSSPSQKIFLIVLIIIMIVLNCCIETANCNIISANKFNNHNLMLRKYSSRNSDSTKQPSSIQNINDNSNNLNNELTASTTKDQYLKSLHEKIKSTLVNNNNLFKNSSITDKFNISETEFTTKYKEYLELVEHRRQKDALLLSQVKAGDSTGAKSRRRRAIDNNDLIYMHFDLSPNLLNDSNTMIDEASLVISLARNRHRNEAPYGSKARKHNNGTSIRKNRRYRHIKIHVYQLSESFDRIWLDTINLTAHKFPNHKKVRLNVHRAVSAWLQDNTSNQGLQIYCENCHAHGIYVVHENGMNNIAGSVYPTLQLMMKGRQREKRWQRSFRPVIQDYFSRHHIKCSKKSDKCCRRQLKVQFKEISGLDFVIQPKMFDAGYCDGNCPTAYNPAHEHAVLQARLADSGKYPHIPRPCCAPAILSDVDVLHVDEEDSTKLKVTTFKNMRVLQCACS